MAKPLRWWVIPGAMVVLLRVVTLDAPAEHATARGTATEASGPMGEVAIADANGHRLGAVRLDTTGLALVRVPGTSPGGRGEMTVWRRVDGARESTPWLVLQPRVRDDGTIPFAGLAAGHYDFELRIGGASWSAVDAAVPGEVFLSVDR